MLAALDEIHQQVQDEEQWEDATAYLAIHLPAWPVVGTAPAPRHTLLATTILLECGLCGDTTVTAATTEHFDCCGATVCHDCVHTLLRWPHARSNAVCVACHEEMGSGAADGTYHKNLRALGH
jgi:hypothetical protein